MNKIWIYRDHYPGDGDSILIGEIEPELQQIYTRVIEYDEYNKINNKLIWLVRHSIFTASISRAKGAELLGVSLIDLDDVLNKGIFNGD